ncbi:PHP domain-containing protein [Natrarchaeobaculum sulfurireducens]|uniref:Metal-dependent phosphoesterase (PHP family) n=1 Tax=Natrarchaeobaculum sulfurireducens TaxID=2044521 RepID=A0A346PKS7_9EURY|nr:PHP domain-containing protein [Natrarchaeobaculum sulfurireducens]AXR80122.1 Metal-dependent phosphoesterase (PHP family) [Natrarchaeobaculum sulfurireducens]
MPYADLHVHTTRSDGSLELEAIPAAARRANVDVVAVTDHDRLQPFDEPAIERDGVTVVHGIELRVETDAGQRVDLLGYGIEPTSDLDALVEGIQTNRIERGRAIVEKVEDELGVDLRVTVTDGFGRPHVARAIEAHPDTDYGYGEAFDRLIGNDGPCFVPRDVPSFDHGRRVLADAGRLVSLAHPLRYRDPEQALGLGAHLDAIERWYPYARDVDVTPVERAIERYELVATGGSDAHDDVLGRAGLSRAAFDRLELGLD